MAFQRATGLVVSSDASTECFYREVMEVREVGNDVVAEDAGFLVEEDSPVLVAQRFAVGSGDEATGFAPVRVVETVDYRLKYRYSADDLRHCSSSGTVRVMLELDHVACTVRVTVPILLQPVEGVTVSDEKRLAWTEAIENAWSGQCKLVRTAGAAPCAEYTIIVAIDWLNAPRSEGDEFFSTVEVREGDRDSRANAGKWYLANENVVAAHEFGHLLGNIDEYNGACDGCPARRVYPCSIMNDEHDWPHPQSRHFFVIEEWVERLTCSEFDATLIEHRECLDRAGGEGSTGEFFHDLGCGIGRFFWPAWHS